MEQVARDEARLASLATVIADYRQAHEVEDVLEPPTDEEPRAAMQDPQAMQAVPDEAMQAIPAQTVQESPPHGAGEAEEQIASLAQIAEMVCR